MKNQTKVEREIAQSVKTLAQIEAQNSENLESIRDVANEMAHAYEMWDGRILRDEQPVAIQTLDFWRQTLADFLKAKQSSTKMTVQDIQKSGHCERGRTQRGSPFCSLTCQRNFKANEVTTMKNQTKARHDGQATSDLEMKHKLALHALHELEDAWTNELEGLDAIDPIKQYPAYLPSFDEFIKDFAEMLEVPAKKKVTK